MAQPGLHSTTTAVSMKAKDKGKNRKRKKSTMVGGACATGVVKGGGEDIWLQVEAGLGEQEGKVEVRAWRHALNVPDNCCVQLERMRRRCDERWGKWFWGEAWK